MKKLKLLNSQGAVVAQVPDTVLNDPVAARELLATLGYASEPKSKAHLTFAQANCFASTAADIYHSHLNKNIKELKPEYVAPFIVNSTFSIELFLKSIHIAHETKNYQTVFDKHNLKELFFSLPGKIQNDIHKSLKACLAAENRAEDEINLSTRFRELANAFVDWRYMHEKKYLRAGNFSDLLPIMNALYNCCINLKWHENNEK
jgi:hypothetical protein